MIYNILYIYNTLYDYILYDSILYDYIYYIQYNMMPPNCKLMYNPISYRYIYHKP